MAELTETPVWREDEQSKVESWRLAASEADLHTCVELVTQGCNPIVAAEILL
jgi:hypothetical protein